jgi:hypothetical protein
MAKRIVTVENSCQAILRGVDILADAVKITNVEFQHGKNPLDFHDRSGV